MGVTKALRTARWDCHDMCSGAEKKGPWVLVRAGHQEVDEGGSSILMLRSDPGVRD